MPAKDDHFNAATPLADTQTSDTLPLPSFQSSPSFLPSSDTSSGANFTASSALSQYTRHLRAERGAQQAEGTASKSMIPIAMEILQQSRRQSLREKGDKYEDTIEDHTDSFNASLDAALAYKRLRAEKEHERELHQMQGKEENR